MKKREGFELIGESTSFPTGGSTLSIRQRHIGSFSLADIYNNQLGRGVNCVANLKAPLRMVRVWTGF